MDRNQLNIYLCAVLTTLADVDFAPETTVYLALGCDFGAWQTVKTCLLAGGLATAQDSTLKITAEGRAVAARVNALVKQTAAAS